MDVPRRHPGGVGCLIGVALGGEGAFFLPADEPSSLIGGGLDPDRLHVPLCVLQTARGLVHESPDGPVLVPLLQKVDDGGRGVPGRKLLSGDVQAPEQEAQL
jgi:hypothetical protein